jgi:hypothetical protein
MPPAQNELPDSVTDVVRRLLDDEIREVVASVGQRGGILQTGAEALRLVKTYIGAGLSREDIADTLLRAGAYAGVPIEISSPIER